MARTYTWYNLRIILVLTLGSFTFGYGFSVISNTIGQPGKQGLESGSYKLKSDHFHFQMIEHLILIPDLYNERIHILF